MEAGRELDARIHELLYAVPIEWRVCAREPDCGRWEDVQWHYPELQPGEICWVAPAEKHPCYNWLDTDEPAAHGWTAELIADTDRSNRWQVVPFYSTDIAAAWRVVERMAKMGWLPRIAKNDVVRNDWSCRFTPEHTEQYVFAEGSTAPLAVCLAALKAVEAE